MSENKLNEYNSWRVLFYESEDELYEGYLFKSKNDALEAAMQFCRQMSPNERTKLIKANAKGMILGARNSNEFTIIKPPENEKFKKSEKQ
jgi:hypothetical protein